MNIKSTLCDSGAQCEMSYKELIEQSVNLLVQLYKKVDRKSLENPN